MSLGLYALGFLIGAIGVMMVGFGIPINEFSLGNTLIIAGSSAIAGGCIVIGLAAVLRQLNRIGDALAGRSAVRPARPPETAEVTPSAANPASGRVPFPPRAPRPEGREPRADQPHRDQRPTESRLAAAGIEPPEEVMVERPRPHAQQPVFRNTEPPMVEDASDATLSPRPPFRPSAPAPDAGETRWPPAPGLDRMRNSGAAEQGRSNASAETIARSGQPRPPGGLFESIWPSRNAGARTERQERQDNRETQDEARHDAPSREAAQSEPRPVSILKSGVVDGMAYTLYTDGSIEAELAEGVVRFNSIEELRMHLEKNQ